MRKLNSILWVIVIVFLFTGHSYGGNPVGIAWNASYGISWNMNTSHDEVLNGTYQFADWWYFNLISMSTFHYQPRKSAWTALSKTVPE